MVRVRFAPSPTGRLHLGNARTAVLNALFARHHGGVFVLRMDDTDKARCRPEYAESIQEDLLWLGLPWDETFCQSHRRPIYESYFEQLKASGRIYPCFETVEQLENLRKEQLAQNLPPRYHRPKGQGVEPQGIPHWRFALEDRVVRWTDGISGAMEYSPRHLSDPVVMRQDGSMSYLLSSVIDDLEAGITHIIRGADHLTNAAIQIQMIQALGKPLPQWAHFPLMFDEHGEKFSKRTGSKTLQELRSEGFFPMAIVRSLAQLGLSHALGQNFSHVVRDFNLGDYSNANAKFSLEDIDRVQSKMWATMDHKDLPQDLTIAPDLWPLVRDNVGKAEDVVHWQKICSMASLDITFSLHLDASVPLNFFAIALDCLEKSQGWTRPGEGATTWLEGAWHCWIESLVPQCPGFKKGVLCRALRYALTGQEGGPKMEDLLPMIPVEAVRRRLQNAIHVGV